MTEKNQPHPLDKTRQPGPVRITFTGNPDDVEETMRMVRKTLENRFASIGRSGYTLTAYPKAVND